MNPQTIQIILPIALREVFDAIAPDYVAETGHHFDVALMLNPEVPGYIDNKGHWSVALSNPVYIQQILDKHPCLGGVNDLGYAPLCFAMYGENTDAPVDRLEDISAFLKSADTIAITEGGTSTAQFARLSRHLGLVEELAGKLRPMPGGGPAAAVLNREVDVALLPLTNIASVPNLFAKAMCPRELDVQVDVAFCVSRTANAATQHFAQWLLDPGFRPRLRELGVVGRHA